MYKSATSQSARLVNEQVYTMHGLQFGFMLDIVLLVSVMMDMFVAMIQVMLMNTF